MRQRARPHDIGSGVIIIHFRQDGLRVADQYAQQRFTDIIRQLHRRIMRKVVFHRHDHNFGNAAVQFRFGKRVRQHWIHDRKARPCAHHIDNAADALHFISQMGYRAHFAGTRHGGRNNAYRQNIFGNAFAGEIIPNIAVVDDADRDNFRKIDDRRTAQRKYKIHIFNPTESNPFVRLAACRRRVYSADIVV